ncbi:uncharacterized protein LOC127011646 [Drosophila biarmipes]|uniref:uncharacterized protein LOC127011646 n=1 Tax=Drosophila biarmipes TaxID=125945 RepID=UPI0021CCC8F4|nr:uncharacterized protein LOC127011646 [Drosophila biarmipes]XP_050745539.1 uncharacterized protein LOC127011646 [Drosophila biarmipes]XP_050745540.1 uncharacterized protein LOC127011646 [Drosophila biarmipes]XP_050745541.1 uncharacterized protein LOC127011646 [Drosophila biarmipes]XP_050745542.1 uncharacterized protein LOC127011646 [Drosophila biarmipes]XP_050745543.1 uncharacterized protein LOC127011646 [Drosophila biarmipes]
MLADEYSELEKDREAFTQENKFSKTKSSPRTQVIFLSLRIFLRAYKVPDLDTSMLADEYEELEKDREAIAQENKFSKAKSSPRTQVTCRRCEETDNQETRRNDQCSPPQRVPRQQAPGAPREGQWKQPKQQQMQPANTVWRPLSTTKRPRGTTHIADPHEAC